MGLRTLEVYFRGNTMSICYKKEIENIYKNKINIDESAYAKKAKEISKEVKNIQGFEQFSLQFGHIDWYESCNGYNIPTFVCSADNKRKVITNYWYCNDTPKGWTVDYTLRLEIPKTVRGINKYLEALNLNITKQQLNNIRKAMKLKVAYVIDFK